MCSALRVVQLFVILKIIFETIKTVIELLEANPKELDVIFISNPDKPYLIDGSYKIPDLAKDFCQILCYDIEFPSSSVELPSRENVQKALDFSANREKLIITCQAGVSRSSAISYIIKASEVGAEDALKMLSSCTHYPNNIIIEHGSKILNLPEMNNLIREWKSKADFLQWGDNDNFTI